jgi:3',5'-cyclic AMP phosphodiesterase CpdA
MNGPSRLVVAHLSDPHLGAHLPAAAQDLVADVAAAAPDLTVVTGDLTMRARPHQFRQARALLDRLPRPCLVVPGNHDVPLTNPVARLLAPYRGYRRHVVDGLAPVVILPEACVCGVCSMPRWRWKSGVISRREADRLVRLMRDVPAAAVRIVALHHPVSARGPAGLLGRGRFLRTLDRAGVDVVLAGHTHVPAVRVIRLTADRRVLEVTAGTATSRRTRGAAQSWTLLNIDPEHGTVRVEPRFYDGYGWSSGAALVLTLRG